MSTSFLDSLLENEGCAVDSSLSNNPIMGLVNKFVDSGLGLESNYNELENNHPVIPRYDDTGHLGYTSHHFTTSVNAMADMEAMWNGNHNNAHQLMSASNTSHQQQYHNNLDSAIDMVSFRENYSYPYSYSYQSPYQSNLLFYHQQRFNQNQGLKNESNLKSNPSNSNTVTTNSTIPQPSLSIDEILKESVKTGQITPEELNKIHQVIGYDPNTRLKAINDTMNEKSSALESNKVVWEKLSSQLENLEQLRNIIPFTESNKNPYLQDYNHITDRNYLLDISKEKFQEANIEQAILASEANIQKFPDLSESWRVLGECYAENEDDKKALYCLKKAVELDPFNLEAQLALGVSYVNELNAHGTLAALRCWISHHPAYQGMTYDQHDAYSDGSELDDLLQMLLSILSRDPADAQVNTVVGVLYNVSMDYKAAIHHFKKALESNPQDYALLNKLGASYANNKESAEAIQYYALALQIRPTYLRGWVNLGIAYFNMGENVMLRESITEAAKAFVQALHLSPESQHIWGFLRLALTQLDKLELVELTSQENSEVIDAIAQELGIELLNKF